MNVPPFEPRRRELLLATLALLGGCGGVDSGGTGTGASSTYASGPITGFGSIIVNGVRYDDSNASIDDDDDDGRRLSGDDLKLGMRTEVLASAITVVGGVSSATASSIRVHSEIVGPLESVDAANALLVVLGQRVASVATTVFDANIAGGIQSLRPGDLLEVYGVLDVAAGRYVASRIERRSSTSAYKLRGAVMARSGRTITLGSLTIDCSSVPLADPVTALAPGRMVRITLATAPVAGVWRATALTSGQSVQEDRDVAEVEGRITEFTSPTAFAVNGLPVDASAAIFPDGSAGLASGVEVEVRGSLRGGVLVASRVELEEDDEGSEAFELNGRIDSVDTAAMRFVVRGVTVMWSTATRFDSGGPADFQVGRTVEVKGRLSADGLLIEAVSVHVDS